MKAGQDYIGVSVGAFIVNDKGEVFLNKRSQKARNEKGCWEAPGGAVALNETREEAIQREIKEEFGVNIDIIDTLQTADEILTNQNQHWVATTYLAKIKDGEIPKIMEPEKSDAIGWFSLDNLPSPLSYITQLDIAVFKRKKIKRNIIVSLECFVEKNGKYLMLKRNNHKKIMPGVWMAPGGKREHNEGLFAAARREIQEETNLSIKNLQVRATGCVYLEDLDQEIYLHLLTADYVAGELPKDPEDGELVWLTPAEIYKLDNLLAEMHHVLPFVFDKKSPVVSYKAVYTKGNTLQEFILES